MLRTALEEEPAGLYYYSSKAEMDSLSDSVLNRLDHPMTEMEFYRRLALLIAGINEGHTGIMLTLMLPQTKIRVRIHKVRYVMAGSEYKYHERGIIHDYTFHRTIEDYLSGKDSELEFVLELIKKQK